VGKRERDDAKKENRTEEAAEGVRIEGETASRKMEECKELKVNLIFLRKHCQED
jgi:hypothetical protein